MTCKTCAHWQQLPDNADEREAALKAGNPIPTERGHCRCNPPNTHPIVHLRPIQIQTAQGMMQLTEMVPVGAMSMFPVVQSDSWCGQYNTDPALNTGN